MNEIQNKAWNLLTEKEKQALTLGLGYAKSSWEVGEMMGLSHYKFLELKERAERFFKLFEITYEGFITESSFIKNICKVFMSDLDTKMRMTFNM